MNYGRIKKNDIANGPGVRVSLFVSGCRNRCPGCFNPETWDFSYGEPFTRKTEKEIIKALRPSWIQGLSILGGDPMEPENQRALLPFGMGRPGSAGGAIGRGPGGGGGGPFWRSVPAALPAVIGISGHWHCLDSANFLHYRLLFLMMQVLSEN